LQSIAARSARLTSSSMASLSGDTIASIRSSAGSRPVGSELAPVMNLTSVCVFCGSNPGADPIYVQTARRMGELLAARGITLVYGGGRVGLMGAVAEAALRGGGKVIGVIPEA